MHTAFFSYSIFLYKLKNRLNSQTLSQHWSKKWSPLDLDRFWKFRLHQFFSLEKALFLLIKLCGPTWRRANQIWELFIGLRIYFWIFNFQISRERFFINSFLEILFRRHSYSSFFFNIKNDEIPFGICYHWISFQQTFNDTSVARCKVLIESQHHDITFAISYQKRDCVVSYPSLLVYGSSNSEVSAYFSPFLGSRKMGASMSLQSERKSPLLSFSKDSSGAELLRWKRKVCQ